MHQRTAHLQRTREGKKDKRVRTSVQSINFIVLVAGWAKQKCEDVSTVRSNMHRMISDSAVGKSTTTHGSGKKKIRSCLTPRKGRSNAEMLNLTQILATVQCAVIVTIP